MLFRTFCCGGLLVRSAGTPSEIALVVKATVGALFMLIDAQLLAHVAALSDAAWLHVIFI